MDKFKRPPSLSSLVTGHIRRMIVTGELPLGASISERGLSDQLNVSKTPVREALSQLKNEGLVTVVPQSGVTVFTLGAQEVQEICTFRRVIEAAALELAMGNDPEGLHKELSDILERMNTCWSAEDPRGYLDLDTEFHLAFFKHCGNSYLETAYNQFSGKIAALRTHLSTKPDHTRLSLQEHGEIVEAVRKQDIGLLRTILTDHIGRTENTYSHEVDDIATL